MDPNKQLDELFQELKKVDRTARAKQDTLQKIRARVHKKKKFQFAPAFISFAMLAIAAILFLTYNTAGAPLLESQFSGNTASELNEQTIQYVLEQEFNGPNREFIQFKKNPANLLLEEDDPSATEVSGAVDLQAFLKNTYGAQFSESGFENFVPYAFFYHLGEESSSYQISLSTVEIMQSNDDPAHYAIDFKVHFTNGMGISKDYAMTGTAEFAEEGKLQDIIFEDTEGLSVTILENI